MLNFDKIVKLKSRYIFIATFSIVCFAAGLGVLTWMGIDQEKRVHPHTVLVIVDTSLKNKDKIPSLLIGIQNNYNPEYTRFYLADKSELIISNSKTLSGASLTFFGINATDLQERGQKIKAELSLDELVVLN